MSNTANTLNATRTTETVDIEKNDRNYNRWIWRKTQTAEKNKWANLEIGDVYTITDSRLVDT